MWLWPPKNASTPGTCATRFRSPLFAWRSESLSAGTWPTTSTASGRSRFLNSGTRRAVVAESSSKRRWATLAARVTLGVFR